MCSNSSGWRKEVNSSRSAARSPFRSAILNLLSSRGSIFLKLNWSVASSNSSGLAGGRNQTDISAISLAGDSVFNCWWEHQWGKQQRTEVVSVRGLLVLIPRNLVVFVQVIVAPNLCNILISVALLDTFDPGFQLLGADEAIAVAVYPVHYFTVRKETKQRSGLFQSVRRL